MFASLALMAFIWLLLVDGSYQSRERATAVTVTTMAAESGGVFKQKEVVGSGGDHDRDNHRKVVHRPEWHLNYMSKRRVPNGPDPIHNRYYIFSTTAAPIYLFIFFFSLFSFTCQILNGSMHEIFACRCADKFYSILISSTINRAQDLKLRSF